MIDSDIFLISAQEARHADHYRLDDLRTIFEIFQPETKVQFVNLNDRNFELAIFELKIQYAIQTFPKTI